MKNHKELFEALLAGETLIDRQFQLALLDGEIVFSVIDPQTGKLKSFQDNPEKFYWLGEVEKWQIKQKTININGFEVPEPVREVKDTDKSLFVVNIFKPENSIKFSILDQQGAAFRLALSQGLVHYTREAATLHAQALLSFTK